MYENIVRSKRLLCTGNALKSKDETKANDLSRFRYLRHR